MGRSGVFIIISEVQVTDNNTRLKFNKRSYPVTIINSEVEIILHLQNIIFSPCHSMKV